MFMSDQFFPEIMEIPFLFRAKAKTQQYMFSLISIIRKDILKYTHIFMYFLFELILHAKQKWKVEIYPRGQQTYSNIFQRNFTIFDKMSA